VICLPRQRHTGTNVITYCMDGHGGISAPSRTVHVLPHIKRLDDCFGDFLVRVTCPCGAARHIEPEALARIAGALGDVRRPDTADAMLAVREEGRGGRGDRETEGARRAEGSALSKGPLSTLSGPITGRSRLILRTLAGRARGSAWFDLVLGVICP
jgi:hypothetical protein